VIALLAWLFLLVFGVVGASSTGSSSVAVTTTAVAVPAHSIAFTIDGHAVQAGKPVRLQQGEVLRFSPALRTLRVTRLECKHDVHRISLTGSAWRVPDLPTGAYELASALAFGSVVYVTSHAVPCPGA
jgi:hypothetical protein